MLFFLPEKNRKMIRYYGIYAHKLDEKLKKIETRTWAKAIENSFQKNPEVCPDCLKYMVKDIVYSFRADNAMKMLIKTHAIIGGYFKPNIIQVRSPWKIFKFRRDKGLDLFFWMAVSKQS